MVPYNYTDFISVVKNLVAAKQIPMSRIEDAVKRILRVKFETGLFEKPYADESLRSFLGAPVNSSLYNCNSLSARIQKLIIRCMSRCVFMKFF